MTAPQLLASRVMKARGETRCPLCRAMITRLQQIGLIHATGWCHTECINARNRKTSTEGKRP